MSKANRTPPYGGLLIEDRYFRRYLLVTAGSTNNETNYVMVSDPADSGAFLLPKKDKSKSVIWTRGDVVREIEDENFRIIGEVDSSPYVYRSALDGLLYKIRKATRLAKRLQEKPGPQELEEILMELSFVLGVNLCPDSIEKDKDSCSSEKPLSS